jgi:hypothetical protein
LISALQAAHQIDVRTDQGEIQPVAVAVVAVAHRAVVQGHAADAQLKQADHLR